MEETRIAVDGRIAIDMDRSFWFVVTVLWKPLSLMDRLWFWPRRKTPRCLRFFSGCSIRVLRVVWGSSGDVDGRKKESEMTPLAEAVRMGTTIEVRTRR